MPTIETITEAGGSLCRSILDKIRNNFTAIKTELETHASRHQNAGADEVAVATAAANAIPKAGAGSTLADGWIAESNVTQHEAAIDHDALDNFAANEHVAITESSVADGELVQYVTDHWENQTLAESGVVAGVAAGYKLARGTLVPDATPKTVVTGLATVVAAVVSFKGAPTLTHMFTQADIGDQSGSPAAGSIYITTTKPTAVDDVTPIAATTPWGAVDWIAIGT